MVYKKRNFYSYLCLYLEIKNNASKYENTKLKIEEL